MNTCVSILIVVLALTVFGCSRPVQSESEQLQTNTSPYVRPADARLTIAEVSQIASNSVAGSKYHVGDFTQSAHIMSDGKAGFHGRLIFLERFQC